MQKQTLLVFSLWLGMTAACASNHRVSPFPEIDPAALLKPDDDLDGALERARAQAKSDRLSESSRVDGVLRDGKPFVALGFTGQDALGRALYAVRVVTPSGIVLALGPDRNLPRDASAPSKLLLDIHGAYPSGKDLTGDGMPDLIIAADDGSLAVFRIDRLGTLRYPVVMDVPADRVVDLNEDGVPDLGGVAPVPAGDPIAPELLEVAVCTGAGFTARHPATVAWHRAKVMAINTPSDAPPEKKLKAAIEKSFHAMRGGARPADAFADAAALATSLAPLAPGLAVSWVKWRGWLADHALSVPSPPAVPSAAVSSPSPR
ncbi:MAG: VCBS repeat-containing protein [Polyangiaceae bacterium]